LGRVIKDLYFLFGVLLALSATAHDVCAQSKSNQGISKQNIRLLIWQGQNSFNEESVRLANLSPQERRSAWQFAGRRLVHDLVGDDTKAFLGVSPILDILPVQKPSAFVVGGSTIVLTEGILDLIHSPNEFAFVLAHELSHVMLGHTSSKEALMGSSMPYSDQLHREIDADMNAIALLKEAGYDPSYSVGLLERVSAALKGPFDNYPSMAPRILSLKEALDSK